MAKRRRQRGAGSVYRDSDGSWRARISLGVRDGKRVGKKVRCRSEAEARAALDHLRRSYQLAFEPAMGSLDAYLGQWLRSLHNVRESTRVSYAGHINNHISPLLGGIPVAKLRPTDIRRLVTDRLEAGLSPATVRRIHSTLRAALGQGVRDRTLVDNPAHGVSLPRVEAKLIEAMTPADAERIREAVAGTFLAPLVELLLGSGLRVGEALGLDQGDVTGNVVMVRRSKTKLRAVVISDDAAEALERHIATLKVRGRNEPVFFGPRTGQRLLPSTALHAFQRQMLAAGLPRYRLHDLRHGVATLMVAQGIHPRLVADQLGHTTPTFTMRTYAHVAPQQMAEAVKVLNRRRG